MNKILLAVALLALSARATSAEPVQISVVIEGACRTVVQPGGGELASLLPGARTVYKQGTQDGKPIQSCEINVRKQDVLEKFSYCALAGSSSAETCHLSYSFAGGREVQWTLQSLPGSRQALCSMVCLPR